MNETDIGNYRITVDRGGLTITHHENSDATIDLNAREVEVLVEWIAEHGGDSEDRRLAFRLPIQDSSQLKTVIHLNDSDVVVNARSISLSGIYVELPPEFAGEMQTEMQVEVSLQLDSSTGDRSPMRSAILRTLFPVQPEVRRAGPTGKLPGNGDGTSAAVARGLHTSFG